VVPVLWPIVTAEYFDQWFADIARSDARQQLFTQYLGLPTEVGPSNLVPLTGLQTVATALALPRDGQLVDLACGRGGPGMWIARDAGAELIGVDFSAEAVEQASLRRVLFGLADRASFVIGTLESTGLAAGGADAAVCVDAFQFADDSAAAAGEIRRILRPGGRVVLTSWEALDPTDESVSERIRKVDLAESLRAAGFSAVRSEERPDWHETARVLWEAALAMEENGDPAVASTRAEAQRSLATHDRIRRVMATAIAP
jgi:SAM-dependent methyltransferase